jgi:peptidoglycan hydrolase CwlO-like protein
MSDNKRLEQQLLNLREQVEELQRSFKKINRKLDELNGRLDKSNDSGCIKDEFSDLKYFSPDLKKE